MTAGIGIEREAALLTIKRRLAASPNDAVLRESIGRHYEHLERLAGNLRALGMDDCDVDDNIMQVFHAYETELANYISRI